MMVTHRVVRRLLFVALWLLLLCVRPLSPGVASADTPAAGDQVQWTSLNVGDQTGQDPANSIHFHAQVSYQLQSAPAAFLFLFVFEDGAQTSSLHSQPLAVKSGSSDANLDMLYQPRTGVRNLTLLVGILRDTQTLLAWTATNPVPLTDWQAKGQFVSAIQAQQAGNFGLAADYLSKCIALQPNNGNFYYWRADSLSHVGQYDAAIGDYNQALTLMPGDRASLLGRGVAYLWKGSWQPAIDDLNGVIAGSKSADQLTAWAYRARGVAHANAGQGSDAVSDYQSYLSLAPNASDRAQIQGWIAQLQGSGNSSTS